MGAAPYRGRPVLRRGGMMLLLLLLLEVRMMRVHATCRGGDGGCRGDGALRGRGRDDAGRAPGQVRVAHVVMR